MKRLFKITFEFDDGSKALLEDKAALLFQSRVNSSGILSGLDITEIEVEPIPPKEENK